MKRGDILGAIIGERRRQDKKFPDQTRWLADDGIKLAVLTEEFGEIGRALCEKDAEGLKEELIQTAAVCVQWLESIEAS